MSIYTETFSYPDGNLIGNGNWVHNNYGIGEPSPFVASSKFKFRNDNDNGAVVTSSNFPATWETPFSLTADLSYTNIDNKEIGHEFVFGRSGDGQGIENNSTARLFFLISNPSSNVIDTIQITPETGLARSTSNFSLDLSTTHTIRLDIDADSGTKHARLYIDGIYVPMTSFPGSGTPVVWDAAGTENQAFSLHADGYDQFHGTTQPIIDNFNVTPQSLNSAASSADGTTIAITLPASGFTPTSGTGGFTLHGSVNSRTVASWAISTATLTLTLSGAVSSSDTLTYDYDSTVGLIEDSDGILIGNVSGRSITNNTTVDNVPPTLSNVRWGSGKTTILADISESITPTSGTAGFTVSGTAQMVTGWSANNWRHNSLVDSGVLGHLDQGYGLMLGERFVFWDGSAAVITVTTVKHDGPVAIDNIFPDVDESSDRQRLVDPCLGIQNRHALCLR